MYCSEESLIVKCVVQCVLDPTFPHTNKQHLRQQQKDAGVVKAIIIPLSIFFFKKKPLLLVVVPVVLAPDPVR
jgi:hypothetical protein